MKKFLLVLLLYLSTVNLFAQEFQYKKQFDAIHKIIEGYNRQDFSMMQEPWFGFGKLIITNKQLEKEFKPFYQTNGSAIIDTISYNNRYDFTAQLRMVKSPSARVFMHFLFNDNGKIEGMGWAYPPLIYRKKSRKIVPVVSLAEELDSLIQKRHIRNKEFPFNGGVLVLHNNKPILKKSYGFSNYETKELLNDSSLYELASCSKQFTAASILLLQRKGLLKESDLVQQFFPDFPYLNIQIKHLITHTSGLPDYEMMLDKYWDKSRFATNDDVLNMMKLKQPKILFEPGQRFEYSNTGYMLLSSIIEKVSGQTYARFLDSAIFKPLGMTSTRVYHTRRWKKELLPNYAYGYEYSNKKNAYVLADSLKEYDEVIYQDAITGDGTVNSNLNDLVKWDEALSKNTLFSKEELQEIYTKAKLKDGTEIEYGKGVFIQQGGGVEKLIYHTGSWPGYLCIMMRFVDQDLSIYILSNNAYSRFSEMADQIAAEILEGF